MKQKAYIFKSKRAKKLMNLYGISNYSAKTLQGRTFPVLAISKVFHEFIKESVTIIDEKEGYRWHIPIEACNIIDIPE